MQTLTRFLRGNPAGWAIASAVVILIGYADLWRGGTEFASAFLVLGYVFLVPVALLAYGRKDVAATRGDPDIETPPYRVAVIVGLVVFTLYALTLAPSTAMWDTSEYIAAAKVLGIPHPPGNPLFVLIAHAFAMLPIPVSYAARVNLLAATTSAISASLWFLVAFRSMQGWDMNRTTRLIAAVAAAWIGATAFSVWNQSVVNEKVYTVAMLGVAVVSWAALRWNDASAHSRKADALLILIAYLCGLGYTNHPAGFLPLPAFGLFVLIRRPGTVLRWKTLLAAAAAVVIGLTPFAFQAIRAAHHPEINVGTPTACEGEPEFGCTFSKTTWDRLMSNVSREQYGGHNVAERQAPFDAQVGMWWHYFKWQWVRDAFDDREALQQSLAILFLALGIGGGVLHYRRDKETFAYVAPLIFTLTPALIFYLNFKYGWTQPSDMQNVPREVRDRDYFFVWSFATWSIWAGMGIAGIWQAVARVLGGRTSDTDSPPLKTRGIPARAWAMASPVMLIALIPFVGNLSEAPRRGQTFTAAWARDLLQSVEPYGILITNGDNDSFPVWYAQFVEGVRRDVTVLLVPYLRSEWYAREIHRAPVAEYDGSGLSEYAALRTPRPDKPVWSFTPAELDQVPPGMQLDRPALFEHAGIRATIPAGVVYRDHLLILQAIKDSYPGRPIYFSLSDYPMELGLGEYVVSQGFAQRLMNEPVSGNPKYPLVQGTYMDVDRTLALWQFYQGKQALADNGPWIDNASVSIPRAYWITGQLLTELLVRAGQPEQAQKVYTETENFARAARLIPQQ